MSLVHHIILGNKIPDLNQECINSWVNLRDHKLEIMSWTDQSVSDLLAKCPVEINKLYDRARNYGEASDIMRMVIVHSYGGIYVDWDVLLVDPAKFLAVMGDLENTNCVLLEDRNTKEPNFPSVYTNSLFYMRKGNRLALEFLEQIDRNYSEKPLPNTPELTGPLGFTRFLNSRPHYKDDSRIIDILRVYSYDYAEVKTHKAREVLKNQCRLGGAPAIHFWTHSWVPKPKFSDRLLHKISNVLKISI